MIKKKPSQQGSSVLSRIMLLRHSEFFLGRARLKLHADAVGIGALGGPQHDRLLRHCSGFSDVQEILGFFRKWGVPFGGPAKGSCSIVG